MIPDLAWQVRSAATPPAALLLDLDGVVYAGDRLVPHADEAERWVRSTGTPLRYVTNNASRTPAQVADKLRGLGLQAADDEVVTSAVVAVDVIAARLAGAGGQVAVVGGAGLHGPLDAAGLSWRPARDARTADVLVQGFDPGIGWTDLAAAARLARSGSWWIATNLDTTIPTGEGIAPGNGSLVAAVAAAAGRRPDAAAGKPDPQMALRAVASAAAAAPGAVAPIRVDAGVVLVGDRLDTDIACAAAAGITGMFVLSGVHGPSDLLAAAADRRPVLLGRDVADLRLEHPRVVTDGAGAVRCRDAAARVTLRPDGSPGVPSGGRPTVDVVVRDGTDPLDTLRVLAAAVWQAVDSAAGAAGTPAGTPPEGVIDVVLSQPEVQRVCRQFQD